MVRWSLTYLKRSLKLCGTPDIWGRSDVNGVWSIREFWEFMEVQNGTSTNALPLINPVTGDENELHIVFPSGGLIRNDGDSATTSTMKVDYGAVKFDHSGLNAIFAPVEWSNQ